MYWVQQFLDKYPSFCKKVAGQYLTYHLRSQRTAQVRLLHAVNEIARHYSEMDLFDILHQDDDNFQTNIQEPHENWYSINAIE